MNGNTTSRSRAREIAALRRNRTALAHVIAHFRGKASWYANPEDWQLVLKDAERRLLRLDEHIAEYSPEVPEDPQQALFGDHVGVGRRPRRRVVGRGEAD